MDARCATSSPACVAGSCQKRAENFGECSQAARVVREFIDANKACSEDSDRGTQFAGCGVTDDGCTDAVYVNQSIDTSELDRRRRALATCVSGGEAIDCAACLRGVSPGACISGLCQISAR